MSYITRNLKSNITYWAPGAPTVTGGRSFATPVTLKGRWEERTTLFIDVDGQEKTSRGRIYLDSDVETRGYLFLGVSTEADPTIVSGSQLIKDFRKIPNLSGNLFERRALV